MLILTYVAEICGSLTYVAMFGQFWVLPFLIWLEVAYTAESNKWVVYAVMILLLSYPNRKSPFPLPPLCDPYSQIHSTSHPGGMELAKLQRRPPAHRLDRHLQHVPPDRRHHWEQHIPHW
jgi:hypothetical protein